MSFNPHNLYLERLTDGEKYRQLRFCKKKNVLGHDLNCDLVLRSSIISGQHCQIEFRNAKMYIRDIVSRNETFVNDSKVIQETELVEGDLIGIGCNPKYLEKYRMEQDFLIYKVQKEIIGLIELNSSDEEGERPNDEVKQSPESPEIKIEEPEEPVSSDEVPDQTSKPAHLSPEPAEPMEEEAFEENLGELESWIDKILGQSSGEANVSDNRSEGIPESHADGEQETLTDENDENIWQLFQICHNHCTETAEQRAARELNQLRNVIKRSLDSPTGAHKGVRVKSEKELRRRANDCRRNDEGINRTNEVALSGEPGIIDAQHLSNRASSVGPCASATTPSPSLPSTSKTFTTRKSSDSYSQHRFSLDSPVLVLPPEERQLKNKLAERKEKLRMLRENIDKNRGRNVANEKKERARSNAAKEKSKTAAVKVKCTEKNRGDFLANLPPSVPPRRQSPKVSPTSTDPKSSKAIILLKLREYMEQKSFKETSILNNLAGIQREDLDNTNQ